jgi:hypothetical protein
MSCSHGTGRLFSSGYRSPRKQNLASSAGAPSRPRGTHRMLTLEAMRDVEDVTATPALGLMEALQTSGCDQAHVYYSRPCVGHGRTTSPAISPTGRLARRQAHDHPRGAPYHPGDRPPPSGPC